MRLNLLTPSLLFAGAAFSLAVPCYGQKYGNVLLNENEAFVLKAVTELYVEKNVAAVDKYWSSNYIQHNPGLPNGLAPLKNLTAVLGKFTYETGFIVSSGPIVALRSRLTPAKGNASIAVDIYRVEGGKIAEHWDVSQPEVKQTVSGLPMFDPKEKFSYNLTSCWRDAPTRNLLLAPWGLKQLFNKGDVKALDKFWDPTYLQHNPLFGSGTAALRPFIEFLASSSNGAILYETGFSLSKCDIAFVHSRSAGVGIVVDTFRFRDGRFVEHWDIIQTEVPKTQTPSGNAMFDPEEFSLQFAY